MPSASAVQHSAEASPIVTQSIVKIDLPKPFTSKIDDDVDTWLYTIDLYLKVENQI